MSQPYRVLARAYRPQHFGQLIGQDVLVRTLTNAIQMNRVAQAYMLTGVRGVGKTTTARIIAKSLNYSKGPTAGPTDDCPICNAITAGTHPDVLEIDAASNTGVDKMRDLLDSVPYAPMEARYKVYIIDEVHMLSTSAFNALLKTLEEPPPHVIFIFATTDIRKVPITILSRCQRFDLKRVDVETLSKHMQSIVEKEGAQIDPEALALIARAADGSVRDSLSLLDRAIALATGEPVTGVLVKDMLGLSDHRAVFDLWALAITGQSQSALTKSDAMRRDGIDPVRLAMDLCDLTHRAARVKVGAGQGDDTTTMAEIVANLSLPALNRAWSLCLKGVQDIAHAPDPAAALDLTLIRLGYAATLPDPGKLVKALHESTQAVSHTPVPDHGGQPSLLMQGNGAPVMTQVQAAPHIQLNTLQDVVALATAQNEPRLVAEIRQSMEFVSLKPGVLEIILAPHADTTLTTRLGKFLREATGENWMISIARGMQAKGDTLAQQESNAINAAKNDIMENQIVRELMTLFPGTQIIDITNKE